MKLWREESGVAMITAVLISLVLTSMIVTAYSLSAHNVDQSANDRRRVDAIHAAEAGIDSFLIYLSTAPTTQTACWLPDSDGSIPSSAQTKTLTATPPASYKVSGTYYQDAAASTLLPCTAGRIGSTSPAAVLIHSIGTAANVTRTMDAWYYIQAVPAGAALFQGAVFSYNDATFSGGSAQFSSTTHNGDLYSQVGDINLSSSSLIDGAVSARTGKLTLSGSAQIMKDATSYGDLTTSGSVIIWGNGRSSMGKVQNAAVIKGVEYYCTSKSGTGLTSPGTVHDCNSALPTDRNGFPYYTYSESQWTAGGLPEGPYTAHNFSDCTSASNYIKTGPTGNNLVRITGCTSLNFPNGQAIPVNGNLAVVSDGSLNLSGGSYWSPPNSNTGYFLHLMFNIGYTVTSCGNLKGLVFSGGSTTGAGINAMLYSPCFADFSGGSFSGTGQVIAGTVNFSGGSSINAVTVYVPTSSAGSGFVQKFRYRREVPNS